MVVGHGRGMASRYFVEGLGQLVRVGVEVEGVPTSRWAGQRGGWLRGWRRRSAWASTVCSWGWSTPASWEEPRDPGCWGRWSTFERRGPSRRGPGAWVNWAAERSPSPVEGAALEMP